jgi:HD-GYP domain-containing protein (c-di-GMP phosphodiesterase class II)
MALLLREAGTAFDPRCVEALQRVLAREDAAAQPRPAPVGARRAVVV